MSARYLLDSNVLSEPLRPRPSERLMEQLERHSEALATSATVFHEMHFGLEKLGPSRRRDAIAAHLANVAASMPILPYNHEAALWHARERARLERLGRPASYRDSEIAAVAHVNGLIVVTANLRDFESFSGLEVESWL